jgi:hypothetical protein
MAETLFLRGVDRSRPVGSIDGLVALVELGHRLLDAKRGAARARDYPGHQAGAGELAAGAGTTQVLVP